MLKLGPKTALELTGGGPKLPTTPKPTGEAAKTPKKGDTKATENGVSEPDGDDVGELKGDEISTEAYSTR
jgi:hypothetical protein